MNLFPVRFMHKKPNLSEAADHVSLLSYNVRMFDRYMWSNDNHSKENIFKLIRETEPDIISFQEFYTSNKSGSREQDIKTMLSPYRYYSIYYSKKTSANTGYGIATYSKYPILKTSRIPFDETYNLAIYTDIIVLKDTLRVFNIHLQSIRLNTAKYNAIDSLSLRNGERQMQEVKAIGSLIGKAFIKRAEQSKIMHNYIADSPYPVVVMGDFNDTPISYAYHKIKKGLHDAFRTSGKGLGNTYAGDLPSYRIDYILHSRELQSLEFLRLKTKHSDHFPIQATIRIGQQDETKQ
jgi:endonuclease/exonuclease/phosphatase family metal-dependent hydrolase